MKRRDKEEERCEVVSKQSAILFADGMCWEDRIPTFSRESDGEIARFKYILNSEEENKETENTRELTTNKGTE